MTWVFILARSKIPCFRGMRKPTNGRGLAPGIFIASRSCVVGFFYFSTYGLINMIGFQSKVADQNTVMRLLRLIWIKEIHVIAIFHIDI